MWEARGRRSQLQNRQVPNSAVAAAASKPRGLVVPSSVTRSAA